MKKSILLLLLLSILTFNTYSQILPPRTPSPFNVKQLHCGHSLTSPLFMPWPGQYVEAVADENSMAGWQIMDVMVGSAALPGAWMYMHWNYTSSPCWPTCYATNCNPRAEISNWELLVITENFQGPADFDVNQSPTHLTNFVNNSWLYGNDSTGAETMLWTNWPALDGTPYYAPFNVYGFTENATTYAGFRALLDFMENEGVDNEGGWQGMQDSANANRVVGCPPVYIIPGNRMMARFYDDIQASLVPGITDMAQIFTDGVHTNDTGSYMVSMIHYACIFGTSPVGLSNQLHASCDIDSTLALYIQNMVWDVVTNYPRSGVVESFSVEENITENFVLYPNPSAGFITIQTNEEKVDVKIFDASGKLVILSNQKLIDVGVLSAGIYTVQVNTARKKFIKS